MAIKMTYHLCHHQHYSCLVSRSDHGLALAEIIAHRFLYQHMLAVSGGFYGSLFMQAIGQANHDSINFVARHQLAPITILVCDVVIFTN